MGGAVKAVKSIFSPPKPPPPQPVPKAPDFSAASGKSTVKKLRNRYSRRKTILTSGQGVDEEAEIVKKTLLGE